MEINVGDFVHVRFNGHFTTGQVEELKIGTKRTKARVAYRTTNGSPRNRWFFVQFGGIDALRTMSGGACAPMEI